MTIFDQTWMTIEETERNIYGPHTLEKGERYSIWMKRPEVVEMTNAFRNVRSGLYGNLAEMGIC